MAADDVTPKVRQAFEDQIALPELLRWRDQRDFCEAYMRFNNHQSLMLTMVYLRSRGFTNSAIQAAFVEFARPGTPHRV